MNNLLLVDRQEALPLPPAKARLWLSENLKAKAIVLGRVGLVALLIIIAVRPGGHDEKVAVLDAKTELALRSADPDRALDRLIQENRAEINALLTSLGAAPFSEADWADMASSVPPRVPRAAIEYLRARPHLAQEFDAKYGAGTAAHFLAGK